MGGKFFCSFSVFGFLGTGRRGYRSSIVFLIKIIESGAAKEKCLWKVYTALL
jgi:hypothetical protein